MRRSVWLVPIMAAILLGCSKRVDLKTIRPGPDGRISWEDAKRVLLHPDVRSVTQFHSHEVILSMQGRKEYRTTEPAIDEVWNYIKANHMEGRVRYSTE